VPIQNPKTGKTRFETCPDGIARYCYYVAIQGGGYSYYTQETNVAFPAYSPKREMAPTQPGRPS